MLKEQFTQVIIKAADAVVHKTFLELHSKTELQHCAQQLKLPETNILPNYLSVAPVCSDPVDEQTASTG